MPPELAALRLLTLPQPPVRVRRALWPRGSLPTPEDSIDRGGRTKTMSTKIFCIGFHKTGTTSLAEALRILGYRVTGPNGVTDPDIAQNVFSMAHALVEEYDAFQDNPWPIIYKELDAKYANSKFIITVRSSESWINSQVRHFGRRETPMRHWIYGAGCPEGNEDIYVRRFEGRNDGVFDYFKDRPDDLLVLPLTEGEGWARLCPFLGKDIPNEPFPHANKAGDREEPNRLSTRLLRKTRGILRSVTKGFS